MDAATIAACGLAFAAVCYGIDRLSSAWNERKACRVMMANAGAFDLSRV